MWIMVSVRMFLNAVCFLLAFACPAEESFVR